MKKKILLLSSFCFLNTIFAQLIDPIPGDDWSISQIGSNNLLTNPYDIAIAPDGYLWITERTLGDITRFNPITGAKDLLTHLNSLYSVSQQDGLMGLVLHPQLGQNTGNDYVYIAYTYDAGLSTRKLRIARFTYTISNNDGVLGNETTIIEGVPASSDHNSGRLAIGPDLKLYYAIGDQGGNQYANVCTEIKAQNLPTSTSDYFNYQGKILRLNLDGTIPLDNPTLNGIKSHVYSYGIRNAQGLVFGANGKLYASEHGPKSDDEINIIESGKNYGWPYIAGYNDSQSYSYCNWSSGSSCSGIYSEYNCPAGVIPLPESSWIVPSNFKEPIKTWGTVPSSFNFQAGCGLICWPTVAPCGMDIYQGTLIPNWNKSLIVATLKRGRIYRAKITPDGNGIVPITDPEPDNTNDDFEELWYTQNRYRDVVVSPDGLTFYIITDSVGSTSGPSNNSSIVIQNPGIIIKVKYTGALLSTDTFSKNFILNLIPNPAKTEFKIDFSDSQITIDKAQIMDINGRIIKEISAVNVNKNIQIDSLNNGLYIVNIFDKNGNKAVKKLVVNK
jgi:aldose sugar dehydrogenase